MNAEKGIETVEKVLEGVGHILAEAISEMATVRDGVRKVVWKTGKIVTSKAEMPEGQGLEYRDYFDYSEPVAQIPPHRILAINRGDKEGPLKVRHRRIPARSGVGALRSASPGRPSSRRAVPRRGDRRPRAPDPAQHGTRGSPRPDRRRREARRRGLRQEPARAAACSRRFPSRSCWRSIPGSERDARWPCSIASGNLLDQAVIYPHPPQNRRSEAKVALKDLVGKHQVGVVAIGNGTACRETEELVAEIIAEGIQFSSPDYVPARSGRRGGRRPAGSRGRCRQPRPLPSDAATSAAGPASGEPVRSDGRIPGQPAAIRLTANRTASSEHASGKHAVPAHDDEADIACPACRPRRDARQ